LLALVFMTDSENASKVIEILKEAEREPAQTALSKLNGLIGLVRGSQEGLLEVEEARADAFMAICELAKALHRGMPAKQLWSSAMSAAERWRSLV
jgi:hypothetical protein